MTLGVGHWRTPFLLEAEQMNGYKGYRVVVYGLLEGQYDEPSDVLAIGLGDQLNIDQDAGVLSLSLFDQERVGHGQEAEHYRKLNS